ncbi:MAG: hypothetical protein ACREC0_10260 [Methylocella sp.]
MKRDEIVMLAALFIPIALGTIIYTTLPLFPILVMLAMEPRGTGCNEGPLTGSRSANARGDVAAEYAKTCTGVGTVVEYSVVLQAQGTEKLVTLVEHSQPHYDYPKFRWIDDDTLVIDVGEIRSVWAQVDRVGSIHITYLYTKTKTGW